MKSIVIHQSGNSSVFQEADIPMPVLKPGYVLLKVAATSINPIDVKMRQGIFPRQDFPCVLHGDVSGTVVELGEGVDHFNVGDEVYGYAGGVAGEAGALAEYMLVDARLIAHRPKSLTLEDCAALPLVGITAWEAIVTRLKIQRDQKILVHGAAGGVGHIAVQLAKSLGAQVFTTVSNDQKAKIAKQLGADEVILYPKETVEAYVQKYTNGNGFEAVFDTVGGKNVELSFEAAALNGQVASIQLRSTHDLNKLHGKNLSLHGVLIVIPLMHGIGREHHAGILQHLTALVDAGKLKPLIDEKRFTFREIAKAHDYWASGQALGKILAVAEF